MEQNDLKSSALNDALQMGSCNGGQSFITLSTVSNDYEISAKKFHVAFQDLAAELPKHVYADLSKIVNSHNACQLLLYRVLREVHNNPVIRAEVEASLGWGDPNNRTATYSQARKAMQETIEKNHEAMATLALEKNLLEKELLNLKARLALEEGLNLLLMDKVMQRAEDIEQLEAKIVKLEDQKGRATLAYMEEPNKREE